jgi:hypothetical protein
MESRMQQAASSKTAPLEGETRSRTPIGGAAGRMAANAGIGESHATGKSIVPDALQKAVPKAVEDALPNNIHDTGSTGLKSHAKAGGSILPETVQQMVPESVERMVPNSIHDTGDKKVFGKK